MDYFVRQLMTALAISLFIFQPPAPFLSFPPFIHLCHCREIVQHTHMQSVSHKEEEEAGGLIGGDSLLACVTQAAGAVPASYN